MTTNLWIARTLTVLAVVSSVISVKTGEFPGVFALIFLVCAVLAVFFYVRSDDE